MKKRVFIIHGWMGSPDGDWLPWLRDKLQEREFDVSVPEMPDSEIPVIKNWVSAIKNVVGVLTEEDYFVGHSIGCQAILRYLMALPDNNKCGGVVLVAPWINLLPAALETEEDKKIAEPWLTIPLEWEKIRIKIKKAIAIFSDNDYFVPVSNKEVFDKNLGSKIIIEHNKGHFNGGDGVKELPSVFDSVLDISSQ